MPASEFVKFCELTSEPLMVNVSRDAQALENCGPTHAACQNGKLTRRTADPLWRLKLRLSYFM
jgi:hypothetical protein